MFHDGQKFDVRVAELLDVGNQLVGELAVAEPAIVFFRNTPPGAEVHFVNRNGLLEPVSRGPLLYPVRIVPGMFVEPRDDRAGVRPQFRGKTVRIGFQRQNIILRADDFVFVDDPFVVVGDEKFPDAGIAARTHWADAAVPAVEIANHADAARVGSPEGKVHSGDAFKRLHMRAKLFVSVVMAPFAHQVEIELGKEVREGVGIVRFPDVPVLVSKAEAIAGRRGSEIAWRGKGGLEKSRIAQAPHRNWIGLALGKDLSLDGARLKRANGPQPALRRIHRVRTEQAEWIGIARRQQGRDAGCEVVHDRRFRARRGQFRHWAILAEATRTANWRCEPSCAEVWGKKGSGPCRTARCTIKWQATFDF